MTGTIAYIRNSLEGMYPLSEIRALTRLMMERVCGLMPYQLLAGGDKVLSAGEKERIRGIVGRLRRMEPVQYIIGEADFYGLPFEVNPSVLIPRPETEELVGRVLEDVRKRGESGIGIADIGTGSGCIAVTLKKHLPWADVTAVDVSEEALRTARRNAGRHHVAVSFVRTDILRTERALEVLPAMQDVIVSNPPYVREEERRAMDRNVLDYEPPLALFVPDGDPLLFYRQIARFGRTRLKKYGRLYFEINAAFGSQTVRLLESEGYADVELFRDLSGKDRIVKARR